MRKLHAYRLAISLLALSFVPFVGLSCDEHLSSKQYNHVRFVQNMGQWNSSAHFQGDLDGGKVWLESNGFTFQFFNQEDVYHAHLIHHGKGTGSEIKVGSHVYKQAFTGANNNFVEGINKRPENFNYFTDPNPKNWVGNAPSYSGVVYENFYNGIDLFVTSDQHNMKYEFHLQPEADASLISWGYEGVYDFNIVDNRISINTTVGELVELEPYAYQYIKGEKVQVPCQYVINQGQVQFHFPGGFDNSEPLIIDPTLVFSSYTGSTADNWGFTAANDRSGNLYAGSVAFGAGYPTTTGAIQTAMSGGDVDVAISKFSNDGSSLVYSTYIGGTGSEAPHSLIVNNADELLVYGTTSSSNFPLPANAYDNSFNGGAGISVNSINYLAGSDGFVVKLNASGSVMIGGTFLGGTGNDGLNLSASLKHNYADEMKGEVVVDHQDYVVVASSTLSTDFPVTSGAYGQSSNGNQEGFVCKLSPNLDSLIWSSYVGGGGDDASYATEVASNGTVYVSGGTTSTNFQTSAGAIFPTYQGGASDGYVISLSGDSGSFVAGTYIGTNSYDQSYLLELDDDSEVYIAGQTRGAYPVTPGLYSNTNGAQFIHKLSPDLTNTEFSTVFGSGSSSGIDISFTAFLVDECENIYVSGWGGSTNSSGSTFGLAVTSDAYQSSTDGSDFYFLVLNRGADSLLYASFFGGSSTAEHVDGGTSRFDKNGTIYQAVCAGCGGSSGFPTTIGAYSQTNNSSNCNLAALKMEFNYSGVYANASVPPDILVCSVPADVQLNGGGAGIPHHIWSFGDGDSSTAANPLHTYQDTGIYDVTYVAIDSGTCNIADTAYLQVHVQLPDTFSAILDIAPFDPCTADSLVVDLTFTGTGADSIIWDMGDGTIVMDTVVNHVYVNQGEYVITMTAYDNLCNSQGVIKDTVTFLSDVVFVQVSEIPDVFACSLPADVQFSLDSSNAQGYYWDFGDGTTSTSTEPLHSYQDTGVYTVTYIAIDSLSCNQADTGYLEVVVVEPETFSAEIDAIPGDPCDSDSMLVSVGFTGTGADSIIWDMGDGNVYHTLNVNHYYSDTGMFVVTMTAYDTVCGNVGIITDTVNYQGFATYTNATAPSDISACDFPAPITFDNGGVIGTPNHYWDFGDGSTSNQANPTYTYLDTGVYTVTYIAIDSSSCNVSDTAQFTVTVEQSAEMMADFIIDPIEPCDPTQHVSLNLSGFGIDSIVWDMGDGSLFYTSSVDYDYEESGQFTITLNAYDFDCNKTEEFTEDIIFEAGPESDMVTFPNIISPNDDGVNDAFFAFYPSNTGYDLLSEMEEYHVSIYDRWGKLMFSTDDSSESIWRGTNRAGNNVTEGVYYFFAVYKRRCLDFEPLEERGTIQVVR